jgi:hypothetical protein
VRDLATLSAASNEADFLFAVAHVGGGRVGDLTRTGTGMALSVGATVTDTPRRRVRLTATTASCPCPTGKRARTLCEHAIAVALADLIAVTGDTITDLTARWFSGDLDPRGSAPGGPRAETPTRKGTAPGVRDVGPSEPSLRQLAARDEVDLRDSGDWDEWDHEDPDDGWEDWDDDPDGDGEEDARDRDPAEQDAVRRFVAGLTGDQARGLLIALASDLPEVADTLLDLGQSPVSPSRGRPGEGR